MSIAIDLAQARQQLPVTVTLCGILKRLLLEHMTSELAGGVTLNFRDPNYSSQQGGYHPVEIRLQRSDSKADWSLAYITDFAFFGQVYPELEKELDFDLITGLGYQAYVGQYPLKHLRGLYRIWESNFRYYFGLGVYQISVTWD